MTIETILSGLCTDEKLAAMDFLWRDLSKSAPQFTSPSWHGEVLADRLASPSPDAALPLAAAIVEAKERLSARRTAN